MNNKLAAILRKKIGITLNKKLPRKVAVISISSRRSQVLNRVYRGKNKATNVFSFLFNKNYGEILVCPAVIRREAKAQKRSYKYQMTWMILHGILHLAGVHHERLKSLAEKSEKLEQQILSKIFK